MPISRSRLVMRSMMQTRQHRQLEQLRVSPVPRRRREHPARPAIRSRPPPPRQRSPPRRLTAFAWATGSRSLEPRTLRLQRLLFRVVTVPSTTTCTYTIAAATPDTTTGTIVYTHLSRFGAAAGVAEAGAKPQAKVFPKLKGSCQVKAHYFKVTRQAMDDVQGISSDLNTWGVQGIAELEEDELLYGGGASTVLARESWAKHDPVSDAG